MATNVYESRTEAGGSSSMGFKVPPEGAIQMAATPMTSNVNTIAAPPKEMHIELDDPASCNFDETFRQPGAPVLPETMRICFEISFQYSMMIVYVIFSATIGFLLMIISSILLSLVRLSIAWFLSPCVKMWMLCFNECERCTLAYMRCTLEPFCRTCAYFWTKIIIRHQKILSDTIVHV